MDESSQPSSQPYWLDDEVSSSDNDEDQQNPFSLLSVSQSQTQSPYKTPSQKSPRKLESCRNCGSTDFYFVDGLGFCSECNAQSQNMSQVEIEDGDVMNLAGRSKFGGMLTIKKRKRDERIVEEKRNWLVEIKVAIENSKAVVEEILGCWELGELVQELKPIVIIIGEGWASAGEQEFLKITETRRRDGRFGTEQLFQPERGDFPHVGHGLTFGLLYYLNTTFCIGYSAEDIVRDVENSVAYWANHGIEGATRNDVLSNYCAIRSLLVKGKDNNDAAYDDSGDSLDDDDDDDDADDEQQLIRNHQYCSNFLARTCDRAYLPNKVFFLARLVFKNTDVRKLGTLLGSDVEACLCALIAVCWAALAPPNAGWVDGEMVAMYNNYIDGKYDDDDDYCYSSHLPRTMLESRSVLNGPIYEQYCEFVENVLGFHELGFSGNNDDLEQLWQNLVTNEVKSKLNKGNDNNSADVIMVRPSFYIQTKEVVVDKNRKNEEEESILPPTWPVIVRLLSALHLGNDCTRMNDGLRFWSSALLDEYK